MKIVQLCFRLVRASSFLQDCAFSMLSWTYNLFCTTAAIEKISSWLAGSSRFRHMQASPEANGHLNGGFYGVLTACSRVVTSPSWFLTPALLCNRDDLHHDSYFISLTQQHACNCPVWSILQYAYTKLELLLRTALGSQALNSQASFFKMCCLAAVVCITVARRESHIVFDKLSTLASRYRRCIDVLVRLQSVHATLC